MFTIPRCAVLIFPLIVVASSVNAQVFREGFRAVTPVSFDSGGAVSRQFHLNAESYLGSATINRIRPARTLVEAPRSSIAQARVKHRMGQSSFADYVATDPLIDGVIVLHAGEIVFEDYPHMQPWQRHYAWSVTKVLTSTALAALDEQGRLDMSDPIERYLPELSDSAWAGTSLRDIANMASGIDCLDADGYQESTTCIYRLEESLGITAPTGRNPDFAQQLTAMQRHRPANTKNEYVSANTNVLGLVIERITGLPFAQAVEELVWSHIGAEADALMSISDQGYAYASGGLSARLRDVARFGEIYTGTAASGVISKAQVSRISKAGIALAEDHIDALRNELGDDLPTRAAWQWDLIWDDGGMYKGGYLGQGLYVDPSRDLVVAWFGTGEDYSDKMNELVPVTRQLVQTGLFDRQNQTSQSEPPPSSPQGNTE